MNFTLATDGGFRRGGRRFVPVGVNYWPASCGVEMWTTWPASEIRADLALVRRLGLNTVRIFLRWQDFEPREGRYDARSFRRLAELLTWFRAEGLVAHPTLFVGFMSGGVFWPEWKRGRNLFVDPAMRTRTTRFAAKVAAVCRAHADVVLALDLGNELSCLGESLAAPPAEVAAWCGAVARAIRGEWPAGLLVAGNEQNQVIHDTGWRLGAQPDMDFLSMHSYPVPAWHAVGFDGMRDPVGRALLPFYTACARAFGPVMVQEFGPLLNGGAERTRGWLKAVLPACAAAGANGYLWWCLRDIATEVHPYAKVPFERGLGLVDATGRVKPGLETFLDFARQVQSAGDPEAARTGLYWPKEYYPRDNPFNPGNAPRETSAAMALAFFSLGELGAVPGVVRGDRPLPSPEKLPALVVSGVRLTGPEWTALGDWVEAGGRLLVIGLDAFAAGPALHRLVGATVIDFRAPEVAARGAARWNATCFPRDVRAEVALTTGRALVRTREGDALVWRHRLGQGTVVVAVPDYDLTTARSAASPVARRAGLARWRQFWSWLQDSR